MTYEELIAEHERITKEYYVDKTLNKEQFDALHQANAEAKREYER